LTRKDNLFDVSGTYVNKFECVHDCCTEESDAPDDKIWEQVHGAHLERQDARMLVGVYAE
jgi:hypothetical protein